MRIALLWAAGDPGLYSNASFDSLYRDVGHNNGNLAFVRGIRTVLKGDVTYYPWHTKPEVLNRDADVVVIPCANQLGAHTDLGPLAESMGRLDVPIVAIGLGAQAKSMDLDVTLSEGTAAWLDVLIRNGQRFGASNIYTRGPYTTTQIRKLTGKEVTTGGCPSQFINLEPGLGRRIEADWTSRDLPRSVAVAGGHQAWGKIRTIEHQLVAMMMDPVYPGAYIVQSMGDMIKISRDLLADIAPEVRERIRAHTVPHYSPEMFEAWCQRFARSYYDVPSWMDELRRHDLTIGARYHGCALAFQAGRMACTVTIDSRTEELCGQTGLPFIPAEELSGPLTRKTLKEKLKFDGAKYDDQRSWRAGHLMAFLNENRLVPVDGLVALAQSHTEEALSPPEVAAPMAAAG